MLMRLINYMLYGVTIVLLLTIGICLALSVVSMMQVNTCSVFEILRSLIITMIYWVVIVLITIYIIKREK